SEHVQVKVALNIGRGSQPQTSTHEEAVMRRYLAVAVAVLALLGALAPPVFAQAPAPKITIEGLVDQTFTYSKNMSIYDQDVTRDKDRSWTGRTRGNLDITAEIGKVKAFTE